MGDSGSIPSFGTDSTPPYAVIYNPVNGSVHRNKSIQINIQFSDAESGIGSYILQVNNVQILRSKYQVTSPGSTYGTWVLRYNPTDLKEGINTIYFDVNDQDGNGTTKFSSFVISTAPPLLSVTSPTEGLITNDSSVTVSGTTYVSNSYSGKVYIRSLKVNGTDVTVSDGSFSKDVTLSQGSNAITIVSTDNAGNTSTITRNVTLDTTPPVASNVTASSTTVNVGGTITITFKIADS